MSGVAAAGRAITRMSDATPFASPPRAAPQAYLLLTLAAFAWGANAVVGRIAIGEISPMALTCLRWAIVLGALLIIDPQLPVRDAAILKRHWAWGLAMGAFGFTAFSACLYVGAYYTSATNLAILQGAIPVFVLIGALLAHGVRPRPLQIVGVAVTLGGVLAVASQGDLRVLATLAFNIGDLMMLFGCACYAGYTLALRRRPEMPGATFFFLMALGGFVASLPLLAAEVLLGVVQWPTRIGLAVLIFVGLFPSLIAQRAYMRGVELIGPGRAGLFVNLVPIFGSFLSVAVLGEVFGFYHAAALTLVLAGILLAERGVLRRA